MKNDKSLFRVDGWDNKTLFQARWSSTLILMKSDDEHTGKKNKRFYGEIMWAVHNSPNVNTLKLKLRDSPLTL